ncbi:MAG: aminopeptidase N [Enterobacterales bacterium]|nr:aminopeptidase N [Enterobacterales bacterium]
MYRDTQAKVKYRKDYRPSDYFITETRLKFELFDNYVLVHSQLSMNLNPDYKPTNEQSSTQQALPPLILDGVELELLQIQLDDKTLPTTDYRLSSHDLTLQPLAKEFILQTKVKIYPHKNTSLNGLYLSQAKFCTQCEAEGFRKITFYLDRPDIMAEFFVTIEANKAKFPLLLSNGNRIDAEQATDSGEETNLRHRATWHDPFPKPSYLFALVAGDLDCLEDQFTTCSGRQVKLELYVDKGKLDQCRFAMDSLIQSMRWDQERFGLEYDLDIYMIVAVGDFNMGAMENKGLNIFNTAYVLANKETATDNDFAGVQRVIAHEYFHNWTGNRVTCRDWFQLSLKEGLTVFRDQLFSEDMQSKAVERIEQVKIIRSAQFAEDASPLAHPIRPDSYIEMNNFYTVTVYNKGAEIIRMMHSLLGEKGFRSGMDLYFKRHTGQAVTCEDFICAMEDANQLEWREFRHWYQQAGTPSVKVTKKIDGNKIILRLSQSCPATPGQDQKPAFMTPIRFGFISANGEPVRFRKSKNSAWQTEALISLTKEQETWQFEYQKSTENTPCKNIIPSLFRQFSAPIQLEYNYSTDELATLFASDPDSFNRWDAGQKLMQLALNCQQEAEIQELFAIIVDACRQVLNDPKLDPALKSLAVQLPNLSQLINHCKNIDLLFSNHQALKKQLASQLKQQWFAIYQSLSSKETSAAERRLQNIALSYLCIADESFVEQAFAQQQSADNMTNEVAALQIICRSNHSQKQQAIQCFYDKWKQQDLVLDKWFSAQVSINNESVFEIINDLLNHPDFSINNPNRVRSVIASFVAGNLQQFHSLTGKGYQVLVDIIIRLNSINPQIGSRFAKQFGNWKQLDA